MNSIQKSKLGAIIIMVLSGLGVIIGLYDFLAYWYVFYISASFLIGMILYSYYLGKEEVKRREENVRRKLKWLNTKYV